MTEKSKNAQPATRNPQPATRLMGKEIWKLFFLCFFLSISASMIPPVGILFSTLAPSPLILIYCIFGIKAGLLATGGIGFLLMAISGFQYGFIFLIQYGLLSLIVGESSRRGYSMGKTLVAGTIGPVAAAFLIMAVYWGGVKTNPMETIGKLALENVDNSLNVYKKMGIEPDKADILKRELQNITKTLIDSIPSIFIIGSFLGVLMNYVTARYFAIKRYGLRIMDFVDIKRWIAPDNLVWILIAAGGLLLVPTKISYVIGLNCLILILALYFLQGIAVLTSLLERWKLALPLRVVIFMVIFFQPIALMMVTGTGLFDIWFDIRKIRVTQE